MHSMLSSFQSANIAKLQCESRRRDAMQSTNNISYARISRPGTKRYGEVVINFADKQTSMLCCPWDGKQVDYPRLRIICFAENNPNPNHNANLVEIERPCLDARTSHFRPSEFPVVSLLLPCWHMYFQRLINTPW